jgi:enamine deaminase RidA (YjgF/YER057c/UK114 family)
MSRIENNLTELKIDLPEPKAPVGAYVATKIAGKLLFISGQISIDKDNNLIKGKVGKDLNVDQGYAAAQRCGLSLIAHVKKACNGDLEKIKSCIKLTGYVNSTDVFVDQPKVINGASDIIAKILDKKGEHTRAAVSVKSLPLGVAVEVDGIFELN